VTTGAPSLADRESWLTRDLDLLCDASAFRPRVARADLEVGGHLMPDDPNQLFRWRLPIINASADVVFEGFVTRLLDYHGEWTREFLDGYVVTSPDPGTRVIYQRFRPGIPGVAMRDLCSAEVVRDLPSGAKLASFRSIEAVPPKRGHVRIDWWGAALCTPIDHDHSELVYLDRENQGGRFPAWLMNRMMPAYLVRQAEQVRQFFATGGPPELVRDPR
jgi:hypothetical protein